MAVEKIKHIIDEYIQVRRKNRTEGELYVSLALAIYSAGCTYTNRIVMEALENFQDNSGIAFSENDLSYLIEHKAETIDYICDCQQHPLLAEHWLYMTPAAISNVCVQLAKVKDGDKVYLPFLGLGGFADNLPTSCEIEGEEYDKSVWAIEKIREWSKDTDYSGLVCGDSYQRMTDSAYEGKYDAVIMAPPYGFNSESKWGDDLAEALDKCLQVLNDNGRIVMFGPEYFNISSKFEALRARLLHDGMVECIINLREGLLLPATGISACIWVVTKTKNENVIFIDATNCLLPRGKKAYRTLNAEAVISIINSEYSEAKSIVASSMVDPKYVMPDKSKMAFIQRNRNVVIRVLWIDDDPSIVESFKELASKKGIEISHFESWDECEDVFKQHIREWDAVILDANCKFHANDVEYDASTFLGATISRIDRICYQNKVNTIPWYVLTEGRNDTISFLHRCLRNLDRPWETGIESKSFYLKDDSHKENALLLDRIVGQRNRSVQYKVEVKYNDVFQAIAHCGLDSSVRGYMLNLLCPMEDDTNPTDYNHRFNDARKTLEAIFSDMINRGFLPSSLRTTDKKGANLSWCSMILAGEEDGIERTPKLKEKGITKKNCKGYGAYTKLMAYNVKSIIFAAGSNEHDQQVMSDEGRRTVNTDLYLSDVNRSSHLIQSYALQLCDIILWYQKFINNKK